MSKKLYRLKGICPLNGIYPLVTPVDGPDLAKPQPGIDHGWQHYETVDGKYAGHCGTVTWRKNACHVADVIPLRLLKGQ